MDKHFWHRRWETNEIAFHEPQPNAFLIRHFNRLALPAGARVFLPLCGKTLDISWFLEQGCRVAGAELSRKAVEQIFAGLGVAPAIHTVGLMQRYSASNVEIFVGDVFDLSSGMLGCVDAVYDRAALVALPGEMRPRYAAHVMAVTQTAPQLLISYEYDQQAMPGPPFAVTEEEIRRHYSGRYHVDCVEQIDVPGGLKGACAARERVWLLARR